MAKLSDWNFQEKHVNPDIDMTTGGAISSKSAIIGVGPHKLVSANPGSQAQEVRLVGSIVSITHGQAKQIQQLMEIGSELPITITGRTRGTISIAAMMFNGPSLLKSMVQYNEIDPELASQIETIQSTTDAAGYGDFFINLASRVFDFPIGILLMLRTNMGSNYGAVYLENTLIASHNWSFSAGGNILSEGISLTYEKTVPVNVNGFPQM